MTPAKHLCESLTIIGLSVTTDRQMVRQTLYIDTNVLLCLAGDTEIFITLYLTGSNSIWYTISASTSLNCPHVLSHVYTSEIYIKRAITIRCNYRAAGIDVAFQ